MELMCFFSWYDEYFYLVIFTIKKKRPVNKLFGGDTDWRILYGKRKVLHISFTSRWGWKNGAKMPAKGYLKMAYIWQHFVVLLIFRVKTVILRRLLGASDKIWTNEPKCCANWTEKRDAGRGWKSKLWGESREKLPPYREQFTGSLFAGANVQTIVARGFSIISKNANDQKAIVPYGLKFFCILFWL